MVMRFSEPHRLIYPSSKAANNNIPNLLPVIRMSRFEEPRLLHKKVRLLGTNTAVAQALSH
jgi:hypothetical protein